MSYLPDLAHAALDLLIDGEAGPWHLANRGPIARDEVVAALACALRGHAPPTGGSRPPMLNRALTSARGLLMPTRASALARFGNAARAVPATNARQAAE